MKETGKIVTIKNEKCTIEINANSGCHSCSLNSKCHASSTGKRVIELSLKDKNLKTGDTVELMTEPRSTLTASFIVFILPLLISTSAYLIFNLLAPQSNLDVLIFFIFFIISEIIIFKIDKIYGSSSFFEPKIILHPNN